MTVSLLRHNSNYGRYSQEKQRLKRCVFTCLRKTDVDVADVICCLSCLVLATRVGCMQPVRWLFAVEHSAWTASATGHHLRTIQTNIENVCVWLVGPKLTPFVWTLRALTRNLSFLLTYLLTYHVQSFSTDVSLPHSLLVLSMTTQSTILCRQSVSSWVYLEYGSLVFYLALCRSRNSSPFILSMCL